MARSRKTDGDVYTMNDGNMQITHIASRKVVSLKVLSGFKKVDHAVKEKIIHQFNELQTQKKIQKEHAHNKQGTYPGTMEDYGPPVIKYHTGGYEYDATNETLTISSVDPETDQGIKWTGQNKNSTVDRRIHAQKSNQFKNAWCNDTQLQSQQDCCGLLSSEQEQGDKLIVAPIGMPLDQYIAGLRKSKHALEPLSEWFKKSKARQKCSTVTPGDSLIIARIISDLVRYINCSHKSGFSNLDSSADNYIIACRRPEFHQSRCRRLMLMVIDFETQTKIAYNTKLPKAPATADPLDQLIMLRSMPTSKSSGKTGWMTGRAAKLKAENLERKITGGTPFTRDDYIASEGKDFIDPFLDDRCQATKIILLLLDATTNLTNMKIDQTHTWKALEGFAQEILAITQGEDVVSYDIKGCERLDFLYRKHGELTSEAATITYLKESTDCEHLWWLLCKTVALITVGEKEKKLQAQNSASADVSKTCDDDLPMLTQQEDADTLLLKVHQAANVAVRWSSVYQPANSPNTQTVRQTELSHTPANVHIRVQDILPPDMVKLLQTGLLERQKQQQKPLQEHLQEQRQRHEKQASPTSPYKPQRLLAGIALAGTGIALAGTGIARAYNGKHEDSLGANRSAEIPEKKN